MSEQDFRNRLSDLAAFIRTAANDPKHDIGTALEQARQTLALMQAEWNEASEVKQLEISAP